MWMRKPSLGELGLRWPVVCDDTVVESKEIEKASS